MFTSSSRPAVVSITHAARLLGYSRTTVYARLDRGDLEEALDAQGRRGVSMASIDAYLSHPPPGSWRRTRLVDASITDGRAAVEVSRLSAENARLREVVTRLQMVREREAKAHAEEAEANRLLVRALRKRGKAHASTKAAVAELDELLTQFLTPDTIQGAE